jgi:hypothetical protein
MFWKYGEENKSLTKVQRYQFIEKMLNDDFPILSVTISIVINLILGLSAIGYQVAATIFGTSYYYIYCG